MSRASVDLRLFEASPAWAIEDDTLVGYDLSFTRGIELAGLDIACAPFEHQNAVSARLAEALSHIPPGSTVRFCSAAVDGYDSNLAAYAATYEALSTGQATGRQQATGEPSPSVGDIVAREKVRQCRRELSPLRRELYCFVSTAPLRDFKPQAPWLLWGRGGQKLCERARRIHTDKLREARRLAGAVCSGLASSGISAAPMAGEKLFDVTWRLANPSQAHMPKRPRHRPEYTLRSQLFASGIRNFHDAFVRDGRCHRVLSMKLPPTTVTPGGIREALQTLPFQHQLVVTLGRVCEKTAERRIKQLRSSGYELSRMLAKLHGEHKAAAVPDHESVEQQRDTEDALARIKHGERLLEVCVQLWLSASSFERLDRYTETVRSRFRELGMAEVAIEELRGRFAFLSMLPGHHSMVGKGRAHPMLSSRAADLLPVFGAWPGAPKPTAWLTTRHRELVGFDPFELHPSLNSWNAIVSASTGKGKSFITKTLLLGWVARGGRMVVVTLGRDYHRFAELLGGTVYDVCLEDDSLRLGPFPSLAELKAEGADGPEVVLEHLTSIIEVMTREHEGGGPDRIRRHLIYRAVKETYDAIDRAAASPPAGSTHRDDAGSRSPTFRDWLDVLARIAEDDRETAETARGLSSQMRFWTEGPYGVSVEDLRGVVAVWFPGNCL